MWLQPTYKDGVWKGADVPHSENYFKIGEKIFECFKDYSNTIGQIDGQTGQNETFASMGERVISCALWLQKQGIKKGDVVSFCSGNHLDSWIPMIACLYIGAIFNPWWEVDLNEDITRYFYEQTEPKILFVNEKLVETVLKVVKTIKNEIKMVIFGQKDGFESFRDILKCQSSDEIKNFQCIEIVKPEEPAVILYTSGTTNYPKGVVYCYGALGGVSNIDSKGLLPKTRNLWLTGLSWLSGVSATLQSILTGSTMVLYDGLTEEKACELIEKYKILWIAIGTNTASRLWKTPAVSQHDVSSLMRIGYGGAPIRKEVAEFLLNTFKNAMILSTYGGTEIGLATIVKIDFVKPTSCGKVIPNVEMKVTKLETGEVVGPNIHGEICYRGPALAFSYWKNPKAKEEVIDSQGWYHTGDLGYYDDDGDFFVIERINELIKYRSHYISPTSIEWAIQNHQGVAEAGVVANQKHGSVEQLVAFITKLPEMQVTESEIHELVKNQLSDYNDLTIKIHFLGKMLYTACGKIARNELRKMTKQV